MTVELNQRLWWGPRFFTLLVVPLIGAYTLLEPFGRDQGIHATIAYALDQGLVTYRDVFNIKPPMTTAMHWLSQQMFGHSMMAIRALDLVVAVVTALGLVEIGRKLGRGLIFGYAVPIGFSVLYYSYGYWEHAQTDGWAGFLVVGAVLLMLTGWGRPAGASRRVVMVACGSVLGLAFAFKYTIGGAGLLILAPLLSRDKARFYNSDLIFCALGGIGLLVLLGILMAGFGALTPFLNIQSFISGYVSYSHVGLSPLMELGLHGIASKAIIVVVAVGGITVVLEALRYRTFLFPVILGLWIVAGWLSGNVQGKGFFYHYLPLVLPYSLLVAVAVESMASLMSTSRARCIFAVIILLEIFWFSEARRWNTIAIAAMRSTDPFVTLSRLIPHGRDYDVVATIEFAAILKTMRQPSDGLFVWGYETMLYFLVETPPRYMYPYSWPFAVDFYDGRYTKDLLMRLQESPPRHFIVQKQDATPWVTNRQEDSAGLLVMMDGLSSFIKSHYLLKVSSERFDLYELQSM